VCIAGDVAAARLDVEIEALLKAMSTFDMTPAANANKGRRKNTLGSDVAGPCSVVHAWQ